MINIHQEIALPELEQFLKKLQFLEKEEQILQLEKPGEGNMNVVLRIITNQRSLIAKQSRPFVQKYPSIPAPIERIAVEQQFYETLLQGGNALVQAHVPKLLGYAPAHHLLLLEDLGKGEDLTSLYQQKSISTALIQELAHLAHGIHQTLAGEQYPKNKTLKALNHQHIFVLPFMEDNGFSLEDIQEGLSALAEPYKKDTALKAVIGQLGQQYLTTGNVLLHGDYYPGSWMQRGEQVFLLDPEFSYQGMAEFDVGVMAAHVLLITGDLEQLQQVLVQYPGQLDRQLTQQLAGVEVMRRLIGLAQLPLERSLEEKAALLEQAYSLILSE